MNKKLALVIAIGLVSCFSWAGTLTYGADAVSRYIWRGIDFGDPVNYKNEKGNYNNSPAFQPGVTYTFDNGISLGAWGSVGVGSYSSQELDELDYTAGYSFGSDVVYSVGYTHYTFPSLVKYNERVNDYTAKDASDYTNSDEISVGLVFNKIALTPSIKLYKDYDQHKFNRVDGADDRSVYNYTEVGLVFPQVYGLANSLTLGFDGTYRSNVFTNAQYKVTKDLGSGYSAYTNLVLLSGSIAGTGVHSSSIAKTDSNGKVTYDPINKDSYEIVFGVNYTGSMGL